VLRRVRYPGRFTPGISHFVFAARLLKRGNVFVDRTMWARVDDLPMIA
jgi:hypothetical protein